MTQRAQGRRRNRRTASSNPTPGSEVLFRPGFRILFHRRDAEAQRRKQKEISRRWTQFFSLALLASWRNSFSAKTPRPPRAPRERRQRFHLRASAFICG